MEITTLLVPHDGSWMADRALACATMLQGATGARLDLLRIAPDLIPTMKSSLEPTPGITTSRDAASTVDHGTDLDDLIASVLDAVERRRPDLVVMASDSWSSTGLEVDVARQVACRSPVPVLVIPTCLDSSQDKLDVRRILVALDGSEQSEEALGPARAFADALEADLLLLQVVTPKVAVSGGRAADDDFNLSAARRYLEDLAQAVPSTGKRVSALTVVGEPVTMIAAVSRTQRADLLAMTTRGTGEIGCSELGGIVNISLQSVRLPLLLVPASARSDRGDRCHLRSRRPV